MEIEHSDIQPGESSRFLPKARLKQRTQPQHDTWLEDNTVGITGTPLTDNSSQVHPWNTSTLSRATQPGPVHMERAAVHTAQFQHHCNYTDLEFEQFRVNSPIAAGSSSTFPPAPWHRPYNTMSALQATAAVPNYSPSGSPEPLQAGGSRHKPHHCYRVNTPGGFLSGHGGSRTCGAPARAWCALPRRYE